MTDSTLTDITARGLRYSLDDWPRLLGRDNEARAVAALWRDHRITILYGRSGIGKTSLLQAGVVPLVRHLDADILPTGSLTHRSSFATNPLFGYNPFTLELLSSWAPLETSSSLSTITISDFVRRRGQVTPASPVLAAIDQAESLFYAPAIMQRYRREFFDDLKKALRDPRLHILFVVRDSHLQNLLSEHFLLPRTQVELLGLERDASANIARQALDSTSRLAPGEADDLAGSLVDDLLTTDISDSYGSRLTVHERTVYPVYLREVTERFQDVLLKDVTPITEGRLPRLLDVDGWLGDFILRSVISVARYHERDPRRLCSWLAHTFIAVDGSSIVIEDRNGLVAGMPVSVLFSLEDHHILRSELRSGSRWFELQSIRLIRPLQLAAEIGPVSTSATSTSSFADHLEDAVTAFSEGELDRAKRHAERALQVSSEAQRSDRAQAETLLGNVAGQYGDWKMARHHYLNAAKLLEATRNKSAVSRLLAAIGRLYLVEGDTVTAIKTLRSALDRKPSENPIRIELARALAASGEGGTAVALLEAVLTSGDNRDVDDARLLRGEIRADLGNPNALSDLERPARSGTPSARASRALILAKLGRFTDAEEEIKQALDLAGDSAPVLLRAAQVQAFRGDRRSAAQLARKSIDATGIPLNKHQRQQADKLLESRHD